MNINEYLKKIEKTKVELAKELNISRPTLNQYIELFESGHKIENERYEIIFRRLFSADKMTREQFDTQMKSVRFLLERDRKYDIDNLKPESADIVVRIHNCIVHDMSSENWNNKVYDAILILLKNYRTNTIMRELAGYFTDLNSDSDLSDLSYETKAYYAYYYECLRKILEKAPEYDENKFNCFVKRKEEISIQKKKNRDKATKSIQDRLQKILEDVEFEFKEKEIDVSEDEMMNEVIRRMKQ